ncbi:T9SS type A sorting domain-containing protein, partial [Aquimarina algiphila]|uniref:T9SS type A sorting domain-containing protein n=1 Tax=Aquimarina algiphila TaxID=2047982 RepID=UPI00232D7193
LSKYLDNTDAQGISLATNTLSISGNVSTVDLSGYLDNTDAQDLTLSGDALSLTNDATNVDLSKYLDNTDAQGISLATNTLSISGNASTVDLSGYLDNTDAQDLILSGNTLSLTNDGTTVDLSGYLDNTDAQTLSLANGNLSISGGNTINLSALQDGVGTDNQNLTSATVTNNQLTIGIENGNVVRVDLSPVIASLESDLTDAQSEIESLQNQMTELLSRLAALESCACDTSASINKENRPILYQNIPNPFNGTSSIKYYLPSGITNASIVFSNTVGQVISKVALKETGDRTLNINRDGLAMGTYFYTMYVGSTKIDTKKMVIE